MRFCELYYVSKVWTTKIYWRCFMLVCQSWICKDPKLWEYGSGNPWFQCSKCWKNPRWQQLNPVPLGMFKTFLNTIDSSSLRFHSEAFFGRLDHHNSFLGGPRPGRNVNNITWSDSRNSIMIDPKTDLLVLYPSFRCRPRTYLYLFWLCSKKDRSITSQFTADSSQSSCSSILEKLKRFFAAAFFRACRRRIRSSGEASKVKCTHAKNLHGLYSLYMIYASLWHI